MVTALENQGILRTSYQKILSVLSHVEVEAEMVDSNAAKIEIIGRVVAEPELIDGTDWLTKVANLMTFYLPSPLKGKREVVNETPNGL